MHLDVDTTSSGRVADPRAHNLLYFSLQLQITISESPPLHVRSQSPDTGKQEKQHRPCGTAFQK